MVSKVMAAGLRGIQGVPVLCECDLANGLPAFEIVGLPDASVKELGELADPPLSKSAVYHRMRRIAAMIDGNDG